MVDFSMNEQKYQVLTPRQSKFLKAYSNPESGTFGNAYRSAKSAGYSDYFARNITHLSPVWLSEAIGNNIEAINPEQITQLLTGIVYDNLEPTIIKLRAIELMMKYHGMLNRKEQISHTTSLNIDLSSSLED